MKRVFIIHGWGGSPNGNDWIPWAKKELENKGYEVIAPLMPDADNPRIETWIPYLANLVGGPEEGDILIGHSIGCQTILRFLQTLSTNQKIDKAILVAGFGPYLTGLIDDEKPVARPWIERPLDFNKIRPKVNQSIVILSDNDKSVPLAENKKLFEESLGAKVIVKHNMGHFSEGDGITELPILLEVI